MNFESNKIKNWNDKNFRRAYNKNYYYKRRQKLYDYLGGRCVVCGSVEELEFDHIDPNQKAYDIGKNMSLDSIKDELDKCQLLCNTCHIKKTNADKQPFTHGTYYAWMRRKCPCNECLVAKRQWHDIRNAKRRKAEGNGPANLPADHGTYKSYKRGCKCDLCRKANADYVRAARKG